MYGLVGLADAPSPWSMIERRWLGVSAFPTLVNAGTSGEIPPRPCGPWHCAHANCTNRWPPDATSGLMTALAVVVTATGPERVDALPECPITQPTTPAGTSS